MNILEVIHKRRSVRTFATKAVPAELLERVKSSFDSADRLNDVPLRLLIERAEIIEPGMTGLVGSYGRMVNPPYYAIGISREGPNDQANFGFVMEQFILECTREGLGTCWVGGFFKKSILEQAVPLEPSERIVCVTPLGYAEPRRLAEKTMRTLGGLNSRKPHSEIVFHGRWSEPAADFLAANPTWKEIFEAARWAPSSSNSQPTRYVIGEKVIAAAVAALPVAKYVSVLGGSDRAEGLDFKDVDAGIAMAHVHLAARHLGISGKWSLQFNEREMRERYRLPNDARLVGIFDFSK